MRVIAGIAKGTRLKVPRHTTRPSTDRLREALFSILGPRLEGAQVLDLFAGSGALGIEALSRGAKSAVFVDSNRSAVKVIGENLDRAGLESRGVVEQRDIFAWLGARSSTFDLIFADPPYATNAEEDLAARLVGDGRLGGLLARDGLLVVEVESERDPPGGAGWELLDRRTYGGSAILFYAWREAP